MLALKPAGLWLRVLLELNRRGWRKPFSINELAEMIGVTRQYAGKIVREMEEKGLLESWYDIRRSPPTRVFRMRVDRVVFTDGYLEYEFTPGLLGGIDIRLPKNRTPPPEEAGEDNPEPS